MAKRNIKHLKIGDKLKFKKTCSLNSIMANQIYEVNLEYDKFGMISVKTEKHNQRFLSVRCLNDLGAKLIEKSS